MQILNKFNFITLIVCFVTLSVLAKNPIDKIETLDSHSSYSLSGKHNIRVGIGFLSDVGVRNEVSPSGVANSVGSDGFLGSVTYNYWTRQNIAVSISSGMLSSKVSNSVTISGTLNEVSSVVPILFGIKYQPFKLADDDILRPYILASFGPFISSSVKSQTGLNTENSVFSETALGAHLGVAFDWSISKIFVLGVGAGHYFVSDFENSIGGENNYSSPEFSLSIGILLGKGRVE